MSSRLRMIGSSLQVWSYSRLAISTVAIAEVREIRAPIVESPRAPCDRALGRSERAASRPIALCPPGRPVYNPAKRRARRMGKATMASGIEERIGELTRRMLRKKLFVVLSKPTAGPERIKDVLPLHLEYMIDLERRGLVFASGPLTSEGGEPRGDGMTILRSASAEEARKIAEADPFYRQGLRTFE